MKLVAWPSSARQMALPRWRQVLTRTWRLPSLSRTTMTRSSPMKVMLAAEGRVSIRSRPEGREIHLAKLVCRASAVQVFQSALAPKDERYPESASAMFATA